MVNIDKNNIDGAFPEKSIKNCGYVWCILLNHPKSLDHSLMNCSAPPVWVLEEQHRRALWLQGEKTSLGERLG